jgi:hypothetical protein
MGIGAVISGRVVGKIGPRVPLLAGAVLTSGGLIGLAQLEPHSSYGAIWPFLLLMGLGFGPVQTGAARAIVGARPLNGQASPAACKPPPSKSAACSDCP